MVPATVSAAPMPCAKRLGGPGTNFGRPSFGARKRWAIHPSGDSRGPARTRPIKPVARITSATGDWVTKVSAVKRTTPPATILAARSLTGFGKLKKLGHDLSLAPPLVKFNALVNGWENVKPGKPSAQVACRARHFTVLLGISLAKPLFNLQVPH